MRQNIAIFLFMASSTLCLQSQNIKKVYFDVFEKELKEDISNTYIVNFWATWCKPCVEELPEFEKLSEHYKNSNVKVILMNLDYTSKLESLVLPLLKRKNIKSIVYHLLDTDPNLWIDRVEKKWGGALPATIIFKPGMKSIYFTEGKITFEEISNFLNTQN
jgi:thiol-disulfide isomerase/thioredoxin